LFSSWIGDALKEYLGQSPGERRFAADAGQEAGMNDQVAARQRRKIRLRVDEDVKKNGTAGIALGRESSGNPRRVFVNLRSLDSSGISGSVIEDTRRYRQNCRIAVRLAGKEPESGDQAADQQPHGRGTDRRAVGFREKFEDAEIGGAAQRSY